VRCFAELSDASLAAISLVLVWILIWVHFGSFFLSFVTMFQIVLAFPTSLRFRVFLSLLNR
jgi:hypothetical protein